MTATRLGHSTRTRFFVGLLALFVVSTLVWLLAWATIPAVLGWKPVAITSDSMAPAIRSGDIVVAAPHTGDGLGPGTVIVFQNPTGVGLVTHRIVDVASTGEYITGGDANRPPDSTPVQPGQVIGVGRLLVPLVGSPLVWAWEDRWEQLTLTAVVALVAAWCSRWALLDRFDPWKTPPPDQESGSRQRPPPRRTLPKAFLLFLSLLVIGLIASAAPARSGFAATTTNGGNSLVAASSFGSELVFYLHNDPTPPTGDTASHAVLPTDQTAPTATTLYNCDTDRDSDPGLLLAKSGEGLSETDLSKHQTWSASGPIDLDGSATLTLWSAIKSFDTSKRGLVQAALLDCASDGSDCNTITTGSLDLDPWDSGATGSWVEKTIDLGTVNHSVVTSRTLRIKIVVGTDSGDDMWFAYDTTSNNSRLTISP